MSNKTKIKQVLADAKLPERSVPVCLQADLVAEFEAAERDLEAAQREKLSSLAAGSRVREVSEQLEQLRARMLEHTIGFRLRALPRPAWKKLVREHPPRKADDGSLDDRDRNVGVNMETFFEAMVRACVIDPELDEDDWSLLLGEKLTDRQFDELSDAAWALNRRDVDVPFSRAASRILSNSESE